MKSKTLVAMNSFAAGMMLFAMCHKLFVDHDNSWGIIDTALFVLNCLCAYLQWKKISDHA